MNAINQKLYDALATLPNIVPVEKMFNKKAKMQNDAKKANNLEALNSTIVPSGDYSNWSNTERKNKILSIVSQIAIGGSMGLTLII